MDKEHKYLDIKLKYEAAKSCKYFLQLLKVAISQRNLPQIVDYIHSFVPLRIHKTLKVNLFSNLKPRHAATQNNHIPTVTL